MVKALEIQYQEVSIKRVIDYYIEGFREPANGSYIRRK